MRICQQLTLRKFRDADKALFQKWLFADHVAKWYTHPLDWLEEIDQRESAYAFIHHLIVEYGGVPIGFCQYYAYSEGGEDWHGDIDTRGAYSIDYLIGDPGYIGKGLSTALIAALVGEIRRHADARIILVQPDPSNKASCGALLSAGFAWDKVNRLYQLAL